MRKYCGNCEAMHDVIEKKEVREYEIKKTKVSGEITILTCSSCGEEVFDKDIEINNDIVLFDAYKKKHNLLTSKEIISIREKYHLSQATFSKVMGFGLKTITRYENGAIQDNTHDNLLRLVDIEDIFYALWMMNKENLTETENIKLAKRFHIKSVPPIEYEYKQPCSSSYSTTIKQNGGHTYDGC
jgi:putative zinc finger/helix-turn-helix YgiT family protein